MVTFLMVLRRGTSVTGGGEGACPADPTRRSERPGQTGENRQGRPAGEARGGEKLLKKGHGLNYRTERVQTPRGDLGKLAIAG